MDSLSNFLNRKFRRAHSPSISSSSHQTPRSSGHTLPNPKQAGMSLQPDGTNRSHPQPASATVSSVSRSVPASPAVGLSSSTSSLTLAPTASTKDPTLRPDGKHHNAAPGPLKDFWKLAVEKLRQDSPSDAADLDTVLQESRQTALPDGIKSDTDMFTRLQQLAKDRRQSIENNRVRMKMPMDSQERVLRDDLDKIVQAMNPIKHTAMQLANIEPLYFGAPVAAFCLFLDVVASDSKQFADMSAGVAEILPVYARWRSTEALYHLRQEDKNLDPTFEKGLVALYTNIIRYQLAAVAYYRRGTIGRMLRALPRLDDVSELLQAIKRDDDNCHKTYQAFSWHDIHDIGTTVRLIYEKLKEQQLSDPKRTRRNVHWVVSPVVNSLFTGRKYLLNRLQDNVNGVLNGPSQHGPCWIVISALGGQGKSEICLQLADRVRNSFWGVFWVDVSTPKQAEAGFLEIANTLGRSIQDWRQVRQFLANTPEPWLLILDNADDASQDYKEYFPSASSGVIILTSRNVSCASLASSESDHISLDELSEDEAVELLLRVARVPMEHRLATEKDARAVVRLLHGHALAIIQAGSYISSQYCTMSEYPKMFRRKKKKLLTFRPAQARARFEDVYATFEASIDALYSSTDPVARDALELLPTLAAFGPRGIPIASFQKAWANARKLKLDLESRGSGSGAAADASMSEEIEVLTEWHLSRLPPLLHVESDEWDKEELVGALNLLESLALITMDRTWDGTAISMHPLIHEWAKDRQESVDRQRSWMQAACIIAMTTSREDRSLLYETQMRPHLRALMSADMGEMFSAAPQLSVVQVLFKCLVLMRMMNDSVTLEQHLQQLFAHLQIDCEKLDPRWLALYYQRASAFRASGKISQAIALYERVVALQKETLSEADFALLDSQRGLALSYANDGQYRRAIDLFEHMIDVRRRQHAEDHPDQLIAKVGLARAYSSDGRHDDAIALLENVVTIRARSLEENHPHRLGAQHWLARAYHEAGQYDRAISLMEYVVKVRCQVLSEDHSNRLGSQHWLAKSYHSTNQYKAAIALLEHVVKIRATALAEDHPSRLKSQHELAKAYSCDAQHDRSVVLLTHVVAMRAKVLAADHPERLDSERELVKARARKRDAENPFKE